MCYSVRRGGAELELEILDSKVCVVRGGGVEERDGNGEWESWNGATTAYIFNKEIQPCFFLVRCAAIFYVFFLLL